MFDDDPFPLHDNMTNPPQLEKRTSPTRNRPLIAVVNLAMLCYAQNERSKLLQRINGQSIKLASAVFSSRMII